MKLRFVIIMLTVLSFQMFAGDFVKTRGKEIILPSGEPILLKGMNIGNWLLPEGYMFKFKKPNSPRLVTSVFAELIGPDEAKKFWVNFQDVYITHEDIKFIKRLGLNSIRLPFHYALFNDETFLHNTQARGFELFDRILDWCRKENLYVILDMHGAPCGQTGDNIDDSWGYPWLFTSEDCQNEFIKIWKSIAEKYADDKIIIGYDLLNEPIAHYFEEDGLYEKLEPLYKKATAAIREVDKNHIIFLGGAKWNTNFSVFGEPFDDNLVYTFHKYWMEPVQEQIQEYLDFSEKYNVPLYLGESGENSDEWVNNFRTLLEQHNIGWCFWPYKKLESSAGIVQIKYPSNYETIMDYAEKPRDNYQFIRENRLDQAVVKQILAEYLENCNLKKCEANEGYIKALGLTD
ncbi:MAG: glycoside hydrolase family 5 protein [Bacteroidetes bacterium]|nr:glycoside hydrolase family 5 protein [Bacteroidota bacterium]